MNDKPRFTHDCEKCFFLGHYDNGNDQHDLYCCKSGISMWSIIARWGNEAPEYSSMPSCIFKDENNLQVFKNANDTHPLLIAYGRAIEAGIVPKGGI